MEMNDGDRRRLARSGMLSGGLWILLLILAVFAPMRKIEPKAPVFAPVKITFAVQPSARESAVAPAAEIAPAPSAASSSSVETKKSSPRSSAPKRTASARSPEPAKTSGGLGIPNFATSPASSSRTDDGSASLEFSSADLPAPRGSATKTAPSAVQEISGVAGSLDSGGSTRVSATGTVSPHTGGAVSADTARTLESIGGSTAGNGRSQDATTTAGQGPSPLSGSTSSSSVTNLSFDGASRKLLSPESPAITLPARLARLVDSDRTVTVQFTVLADGTVPSGLVSFTPSAVLPAEIRDYLRKEFSSWRFEKGAADGQASFRYSIRVK